MPRPCAEHETSPEVTPKIEPGDSRFPTPNSRASAQPQPRRRQRAGEDDANTYISIDGAPVNLGNNLFTSRSFHRRRHDRDRSASPLNARPEWRPRSRPASPQRQASIVLDQAEPGVPFVDAPAYGKGPPLQLQQLDADQRRAVDMATLHHQNLLCIGQAGTGKSETCEMIVYELTKIGKRVHVLTPSGTSAVNVNGQTLHSFFGLGNQSNNGIKELITGMSASVKQRVKDTHTLVFDETSMIPFTDLDRMNEMAKAVRGSDEPFGGIQIIMFGDFCQLPPVKPQDYCFECGKERIPIASEDLAFARTGRGRRGRRETDRNHKPVVWRCDEHGDVKDSDKMWAFNSPQWDQLNLQYISLNQVHRQVDPVFLALLNNLRHGKGFTPAENRLLVDHPCDVTNAVQLVSNRDTASCINKDKLYRLAGRRYDFISEDDFVWQRNAHPELAKIAGNVPAALRAHPYEHDISLKKGQPVILLRNIDIEKGLVNGSQGIIDHFIPFDPAQQPRDSSMDGSFRAQMRHDRIRDFMRVQDDAQIPVVKFNNVQQLTTVWPDCSVSERGYQRPHSLLIRTQIPLLAGWALTIHKAQGMTLLKSIVDLSNCWQSGMAYVALSRAKTLDGLEVRGLKSKKFNSSIDEEVKAFLATRFGVVFD